MIDDAPPPTTTITLRDGSTITLGRLDRPAVGTVVAVVQVGQRRVYQKTDLGHWWRWRGTKGGWILVRKTDRIRKLEASVCDAQPSPLRKTWPT